MVHSDSVNQKEQVLALKMGPFRRVKYSTFVSLYQGQYSPIT